MKRHVISSGNQKKRRLKHGSAVEAVPGRPARGSQLSWLLAVAIAAFICGMAVPLAVSGDGGDDAVPMISVASAELERKQALQQQQLAHSEALDAIRYDLQQATLRVQQMDEQLADARRLRDAAQQSAAKLSRDRYAEVTRLQTALDEARRERDRLQTQYRELSVRYNTEKEALQQENEHLQHELQAAQDTLRRAAAQHPSDAAAEQPQDSATQVEEPRQAPSESERRAAANEFPPLRGTTTTKAEWEALVKRVSDNEALTTAAKLETLQAQAESTRISFHWELHDIQPRHGGAFIVILRKPVDGAQDRSQSVTMQFRFRADALHVVRNWSPGDRISFLVKPEVNQSNDYYGTTIHTRYVAQVESIQNLHRFPRANRRR